MSPLGSVGAGGGNGLYALNRQAASAATQQVRRAEQAERQASELLRESRDARAQASQLQRVARQRETQAGDLQDEARSARQAGVASQRDVRPVAVPVVNPLQTRETDPPRGPYDSPRAPGQLLNISA